MKTLYFPGWALPVHLYPDNGIVNYHFFDESNSSPMEQFIPQGLSVPTHVIGHSMGTVLALLTAARYPKQVQKLTLYAPFVQFANHDSNYHAWPLGGIHLMQQQLPQNPQQTLKRFYRSAFTPERPPLPPPGFVNVGALMEGLRFLEECDLSAIIPEIKGMEIEVHAGSADAVVSMDMTRAAVSLFSSPVHFYEHEKKGHIQILEENSLFHGPIENPKNKS